MCSGPQVRGPHQATLEEATDTIKTRLNQASKGLRSHQDGFTEGTWHSPPPQVRTPRLYTHPWKLPGTVILRFTSAFMTRLTIS